MKTCRLAQGLSFSTIARVRESTQESSYTTFYKLWGWGVQSSGLRSGDSTPAHQICTPNGEWCESHPHLHFTVCDGQRSIPKKSWQLCIRWNNPHFKERLPGQSTLGWNDVWLPKDSVFAQRGKRGSLSTLLGIQPYHLHLAIHLP